MSWTFGAHPDDAPRPLADPSDPLAGIPQRAPYRSASSQVVMRPRAETKAIVVVELLPLLPGAMLGLLGMCNGSLAAAAWAITAIVAAVFASRDRSMLVSRGFVGVPTALLALVHPILYIAVRGRACRGLDPEAYAPLPWVIGATVFGAVGLAFVWFFYGAATGGVAGLLM